MESGLSLAELVASLALATDLAMGHPLEQGLGACVVATRLAELAGLAPDEVRRTFYVALLRHLGRPDVEELVGARSGGGLDPAAVDVFRGRAGELLGLLAAPSRWEAVQRLAPRPEQPLTGDRLTAALHAVADFTDLKSPYLVGHSSGVSDLARAAAERMRLPAAEVDEVGWAALVHDLGRVGVSAAVWGRAGPLTAGEWEAVRLHPYQTERVLGRAPFLARLAGIA